MGNRESLNLGYNKIISGKPYSQSKIDNQLRTYLNHLVELIKKYFQFLIDTNEIDVAVRLATIDNKNKITEKVVYKTYVRSSGLNPRRKKYSEPIPLDKGIPLFFRNEKGCQGILIFNDIEQAAKEGAYKLTENDKKFPGEIKTMMVAPINGWVDNSIDMIGLLYVTSKKINLFAEKDVDALSFVADLIGASISNIINIIDLASNIKTGG